MFAVAAWKLEGNTLRQLNGWQNVGLFFCP